MDQTLPLRYRWVRTCVAALMLLSLAAFIGALWPWPSRPRVVLQPSYDCDEVMFSPDGRALLLLPAVGIGGSEPTHMELRDAATGRLRFGGKALAASCSFSPDSRLLFALEDDSKASLWDVQTGERYASLELSRSFHWPWGFSPDGRLFAYKDVERGDRSKDVLRIWDTKTRVERTVVHADVKWFTFTPDGETLVAWQPVTWQNGKHCFWEVPREPGPVRLVKEYACDADEVVYSPRLDMFVARNHAGVKVFRSERSPEHMDDAADALGQVFTLKGGSPSLVWLLGFSPDGGYLLVHDLRAVTLWDVTTLPARELVTFQSGDTLSPDCTLLAVRKPDRSVELQEVDPWRVRAVLESPNGHTAELAGQLSFSSDGSCLAVAGTELDSARRPPVIKWFRRLFGLSTAGGHDVKVVRLWSTKDGRELQAFPNCRHVVFSPDGRRLAAFSLDRRIQLWELPPPVPLKRMICWAVLAATVALAVGWWCYPAARCRYNRLTRQPPARTSPCVLGCYPGVIWWPPPGTSRYQRCLVQSGCGNPPTKVNRPSYDPGA